jgi:hypothetical protein
MPGFFTGAKGQARRWQWWPLAPGIDRDLAASPSGNLLVGAWAAGSVIYLNDSHKTKWTAALVLAVGPDFNDMRFASPKVAWVVWEPASLGYTGQGKVYVTWDGGKEVEACIWFARASGQPVGPALPLGPRHDQIHSKADRRRNPGC